MQDVEVLKGLKDWIINKQWKEGKIAIPLSILIGLIGGLTLGVGITDAILQAVGLDVTLPEAYVYFDLASTCLILSKGSGFIIDTLEKFKNAKESVDTK
jgi:hypothetical protein